MDPQIVRKLVPHLAQLRLRLGADIRRDSERSRVDDLHLEQLPYCLGASHTRLRALLETAERGIADARVTSGGISVLNPELRLQLGYEIDHFLEAGRRTQNALWPYLGKALRLSVPSSLNRIERSIQANELQVGPYLREQITEYWQRSGRTLKNYRDLSQHHCVVSSDAFVFLADGETPVLNLLLPNNPEVKSIARLKYKDPSVHAISYTFDAFCYLTALVFRVTRYLLEGAPESDFAHAERYFQKTGLSFSDLEGTPVPSPDWVEANASRFAAEEERGFLEEMQGA